MAVRLHCEGPELPKLLRRLGLHPEHVKGRICQVQVSSADPTDTPRLVQDALGYLQDHWSALAHLCERGDIIMSLEFRVQRRAGTAHVDLLPHRLLERVARLGMDILWEVDTADQLRRDP